MVINKRGQVQIGENGDGSELVSSFARYQFGPVPICLIFYSAFHASKPSKTLS